MKDAIHEQLAAARRNQILDSAASVFADKGFHATTIKDIARETGIADGTIYLYFENKAALLLGVFERMRASVQPDETFLNLGELDFRAFLKAYFRQPLIALKGDNFALFRVVISEMLVNKELRELYYGQILEPTLRMGEQLLQQWAKRNVLKPIDSHLTVRAIAAMVLGLMVEHSVADPTLESHWDDLPEFLANLFVDGIGSKQS